MSTLLIVALVLFLLLGGLGFVSHVLCLGLIVAAVLIVSSMLTGRARV